uniref:Uncharacterized protein n=1 Tax=Chromera velia CCMP2878 TaxID=1169474 RepID=A0A0G4GTF4_9ALVE|eukprot:Cvel_5185.t1-p1 / transcript=Cvel_5185.t1 / gene=Cvel_5185 / organism=Chromera_velia_CCMP2878 / gene_product=hypothetical protein / transcript_product=hypothetical protein / location=Cvel_scaffold238:53597-53989(+) / protein_length=131 / sequence_SO=supercontig / SO=protein_coding / is_pseudo=false
MSAPTDVPTTLVGVRRLLGAPPTVGVEGFLSMVGETLLKVHPDKRAQGMTAPASHKLDKLCLALTAGREVLETQIRFWREMETLEREVEEAAARQMCSRQHRNGLLLGLASSGRKGWRRRTKTQGTAMRKE